MLIKQFTGLLEVIPGRFYKLIHYVSVEGLGEAKSLKKKRRLLSRLYGILQEILLRIRNALIHYVIVDFHFIELKFEVASAIAESAYHRVFEFYSKGFIFRA
jgi:hypothetical protein